MAFKTAKQYNEERFGGRFTLRNDGDYADVIFLYRDYNDVLVADTHYIKSADYTGYVHCCGRGCPACEKGIRVQSKLFIPMYNMTTDQIEFWDRNTRFENQLSKDVFEHYPNPVDFVFRITRHGAAGDVNTTYEIRAIGRNADYSYESLMKKFNISMPAHYESVCKDVRPMDLRAMVNAAASHSEESDLPDYRVTPRTRSSEAPTAPDVPIPGPDALPFSLDDIESAEDVEDLDGEPNF